MYNVQKCEGGVDVVCKRYVQTMQIFRRLQMTNHLLIVVKSAEITTQFF